MAATTAEKKKKKERAKRNKTNEVKKKQMTLFAAGMSHHLQSNPDTSSCDYISDTLGAYCFVHTCLSEGGIS